MTKQYTNKALYLSLIGFLATLCLQCQESKTPEERKKAERLEKLRDKVDLPDAPPEESFQIQRKNADGTLKIKALRFFPTDYLDQTIEAKGVIQKVGGDCDPAKDKSCPKPHLEVADSADADGSLMVVGLPKMTLKKFNPGESHTFKGTFQKSAMGFSASHAGVIKVTSIDGEELDKD